MNAELTKQLQEKYPQILQDLGGDPSVTCMAWGIECGNGWYNVLDRGFERIMATNPPPELKADQIKEKFAGLRVYVYGSTDEIDAIISDMEKEAYNTCQTCGSTEKVTTGPGYKSSWWTTECEKCREEIKQRIIQLEQQTKE